MDTELTKVIAAELGNFQLKLIETGDNPYELPLKLADTINHLITKDFSRLISILYRLDISETKLKELLSSSLPESAGSLIAQMIIERLEQKMIARKQFKQGSQHIAEEEKW